MKKLWPPFVLAVALVGCSGDPAPTVGDADISRGIARKPMPKPPAGMGPATSGLTARDLAKMRKSQ